MTWRGQMPSNNRSHRTPAWLSEPRRALALVISIAFAAIALAAWWYADGDSRKTFVAAACGRISIVLFALWLAWPSLKKPARWLPAGAPVIGVVALIVIAAQPRLIIPAIPVVGGLITLSAVVRAFRRK